MGRSAPKPGDYNAAETQDYRNQKHDNRPNINTPFATEQWGVGPDGEQTLNTGLSPWMKQIYDSMGSVDWGSLPQVETGEKARDEATTAAYNQSTSRLDPQWAHNDEAMRAQLANQGLDPNSEANRNATLQESNAKNDAYSGARNSAIEQGREAGNDVFHNSLMARQSALAEALRKHGMPMEDASKLMGMMGMPDFNQTHSDYRGATGGQDQANMAQWKGPTEASDREFKMVTDWLESWMKMAAMM